MKIKMGIPQTIYLFKTMSKDEYKATQEQQAHYYWMTKQSRKHKIKVKYDEGWVDWQKLMIVSQEVIKSFLWLGINSFLQFDW